MKKMMRRWISMLMVVLMTIAMVPMQAFAATCTATINFRVIPVYEDAKEQFHVLIPQHIQRMQIIRYR